MTETLVPPSGTPAARAGRGVRARGTLRPSRDELLAGLASAVLFALSFPPFPLVLPAFVCLVPFALAVARRADEGAGSTAGLRIGLVFGAAGYGLALYWIAIALLLYTKLALLGFVGSIIWLAPYVGLAGVALLRARRATGWPLAILLPVVWVALEVVLNYLSDLSFPWLPLGLAVAKHPLWAQTAELSGVRGTSFWIAATNGLLADAWLLRAHRGTVVKRVAVAALLAAGVAGYGAWRMGSIALRPVAPMAIIQPNIPQEEKWQDDNRDRIVGILASLSRETIARHDARLVIWPEAALPGFMMEHPEWADTLAALSESSHVPILFGVLDATLREKPQPDRQFDLFNAALLTDSLGAVGAQPAYHKEFLVPVVERVPFLNPDWFAKLKYFGGFARGKNPPPFVLPFGRLGVLICYESVFPQLSREYRTKGVDVLVIVTNDAWFGRSLAPYQHEAHAAIRAIENRVGVVRAANTGISVYVDPLGREHGATPLFTRESRTYAAETTDVRTPYVRFGDWLGLLCLAATVAFVVRGRRRPTGVVLPADAA